MSLPYAVTVDLSRTDIPTAFASVPRHAAATRSDNRTDWPCSTRRCGSVIALPDHLNGLGAPGQSPDQEQLQGQAAPISELRRWTPRPPRWHASPQNRRTNRSAISENFRTDLRIYSSVCGSIRQFSFRIGFLEWSRYTLHRPSRIGFLRDAVALTRVTTAGQADSELEEGELR